VIREKFKTLYLLAVKAKKSVGKFYTRYPCLAYFGLPVLSFDYSACLLLKAKTMAGIVMRTALHVKDSRKFRINLWTLCFGQGKRTHGEERIPRLADTLTTRSFKMNRALLPTVALMSSATLNKAE